MRRQAILAVLALLLLTTAPARATQQFVVTFTGLQYEAAPDGGPDPTPGEFLAVGDSYVFVGHVTAFRDALIPFVDPATFEYTVVVSMGTVTSRSAYPPFEQAVFGGEVTVRIYEDAIAGGTPAIAAANPPNAEVPGHFADGTLILGGTLQGTSVIWNTATQTGHWGEFDLELTEGSLAAIVPPPSSGKVYTVGGNLSAPSGVAGYHAMLTGEISNIWVLPVKPSTWGALKQLFR
jgi:hypothetical protein